MGNAQSGATGTAAAMAAAEGPIFSARKYAPCGEHELT